MLRTDAVTLSAGVKPTKVTVRYESLHLSKSGTSSIARRGKKVAAKNVNEHYHRYKAVCGCAHTTSLFK